MGHQLCTKIIARAPDVEVVRTRNGLLSALPKFEVEWYDEQNDRIRRAPVDADIAEALSPKLFLESLKEIGWQEIASRARCV